MSQDLEALHTRYGSRYPHWLLALLMVGSMAMILASTSINVALPTLMTEFAIGRPMAQWLATGFLAAMTAGLLLSAWAQARLGARRTVQLGIGLFILASLLALLAQAAWQLIALRIVQGACAGVIQPLAMVLIFRVFADGGRGMALGSYGLGVMVAPTLGPTIGGYLIDQFGWQAVFWLPLPMCVAALVGAQWLMPSDRNRQTPGVDLLAFGFLCVALFALLGALAEAQRFGWLAPSCWVPGLLGITAVGGFAWRSRVSTRPLLPMRLWRHVAFRKASWVALALGLGLYGSTYLIPLYLQTVDGYSAGRAGLLLLPTGVVLGLASFAGGWLSDRLSAAALLVGRPAGVRPVLLRPGGGGGGGELPGAVLLGLRRPSRPGPAAAGPEHRLAGRAECRGTGPGRRRHHLRAPAGRRIRGQPGDLLPRVAAPGRRR